MDAGPTHSALYRGWVQHQRHEPRPHRFRYAVHLLYLDLEELPRAFEGRWLWSVERWNLCSFRRKDYLGDPDRPLAECVRERVRRELGACPAGPVRLLTNLRTLGYVANPVTFYYVFEEDGRTLHSVVAEITNTPWGERHSYVLGCERGTPAGPERTAWEFDKAFHVSPFHPMEQRYLWAFQAPGEGLSVHMSNLEQGRALFEAGLELQREPLTAPVLRRALLRHPWITAKVTLGIYWQALRLWLKRVPFHTHPAKRDVSTSHG